jgi:hypothetical protein
MNGVAWLPSGAGPLRRRSPFRGPSAAGWFLFLGLALRLVHYVCNHTIWYDEAALLYNVLGKDYLRLLGPLDYEQGAPPLFLWGLRTVALLFNDRPYVWRFPPFALSCLTLLLMAALARRTLPPAPAALVIGLVAFSDAFVWLGCNVKPYILDAFLSACVLYAYLGTAHWPVHRRLLLFLLAAPLLLCLSYPALFVYAGLMMAFLPGVWRSRTFGPWAAYLGLALVVLATFACLSFGPMRAQRVPGLVEYWKNRMPDLTRPASVPGWVLGNGLLVLHYCYNPVGAGCALFAGAGAWWCVRNGRLDWACLGVGPVGACLLAAFGQAYPFSGNRLMMFAAPGVGLMTGLGLSVALDRLRRRTRWAMAALVALLIVPEAALCLLHLHTPWPQPDGAGTTRFVRQRREPGDLVASDEGSYSYFFFGEVRRLADVASRPCHEGQRVWVLMDHYRPEDRRGYVLSRLPAPDWELRSETLFRMASVFLLVRRTPGEAPPRPAPGRGPQSRGVEVLSTGPRPRE